MRTRPTLGQVALLVAAFAILPVGRAQAARRWALVIGENGGLFGEERLRFAEEDARRMAEVFVGLGGVDQQRVVLHTGANASTVQRSLSELRSRLSSDDQLLVYVSSHGGAGDLHLAGTTLPMAELRATLEAMPAATVVLILDTCSSGDIASKGLRTAQGSVPFPIEEEPVVRGRAIIGASSAEGLAQESDALGGSVFTQHLLAGLRGAADVSRDGEVTLQEAYSYAAQRTLDSTFDAQRPTFSFRLAGERDLVLSRVSAGRVQVRLDVDEPGEWLVTSLDGGNVATRFVKATGPVTLALEPGTYRLQNQSVTAGGRAAIVKVPASGLVTVQATDLRPSEVQAGLRKGGYEPLLATMGPLLSQSSVEGGPFVFGFAASLQRLRVGGVFALGAHLAYDVGRVQKVVLHEAALGGTAGVKVFRLAPVELRLGVGVGALWVVQTGLQVGTRHSLGPRLSAVVELAFDAGPLLLVLESGLGFSFAYVGDHTGLQPQVPVALRIGRLF